MSEQQIIATDTEVLVETVVLGLQEKKGTNIAILDMRELENSVCQFFVICEGESNTHVSAVAGAAEEMVLKMLQERPYHVEGERSAQWIIIDFVDVVVHVFQKANRAFYNIEGLWADAKQTDIENLF
jgi:ribosome-associated protein